MSMVESQPASKPPRLLIVMGVSGCGKTTIAERLANTLGATFLDADNYHPASNVAKMSRGIALTDQDRWPWLDTFGREIADQPRNCVGACSALKRAYRKRITSAAGEPVLFIFLNGNEALLAERLSRRTDHFMPGSLLQSQLTTLQPPEPDELSITVDIDATPTAIIERILEKLKNI